jgi:hypothetical protein
MNSLIRLKQTALIFLVLFGVACFSRGPQARATCVDACLPGFNTVQGDDGFSLLTTGEANTALGWRALFSVGASSFNTAVGTGALVLNASSDNTANGAAALLLNATGFENTAIGTAALEFNDSGGFNDAVGGFALSANIDGSNNNAFGDSALLNNIHASSNTAIGDSALSLNDSTGNGVASENTAVGAGALGLNTDGANNTALGFQAGMAYTTESGNICIGSGIVGVPGENNTTHIANVYAHVATARAVYVNGDNVIGTLVSSRRYKEQIKPMDKASEAILRLKPVTFRYKKEVDRTGCLGFGLIAEEVAEINADLVTCDAGGKPETVRYEAVNAMLLNEFLKEHRKVAEQEATITQLKAELNATAKRQQKQIEALTAGLRKVSAQLELSKSTSQTALNNQ